MVLSGAMDLSNIKNNIQQSILVVHQLVIVFYCVCIMYECAFKTINSNEIELPAFKMLPTFHDIFIEITSILAHVFPWTKT